LEEAELSSQIQNKMSDIDKLDVNEAVRILYDASVTYRNINQETSIC